MIPGEIQEKLDLIPTMNLVHKIIKHEQVESLVACVVFFLTHFNKLLT